MRGHSVTKRAVAGCCCWQVKTLHAQVPAALSRYAHVVLSDEGFHLLVQCHAISC